jgi:hypothetical protein
VKSQAVVIIETHSSSLGVYFEVIYFFGVLGDLAANQSRRQPARLPPR